SAAMPTHLRIFAAYRVDQRPRRGADGERVPVERADRLDAEHRVRDEQLVAAEEIVRHEVRLDWLEPDGGRVLEHDAAHHAAHAAAGDARGQEPAALHPEHIARDAADDMTARAADEPFTGVGAFQFHLRQHLLEPAQVLQPRELWILAEPERTGPKRYAVSVIGGRQVRPGRNRQNSRRFGGLRNAVAASARP